MARPTVDLDTAYTAFKAGLLLPPGTQVQTQQQVAALGQQMSHDVSADVSMPRGPAFMGYPFGPGAPITPQSIGPTFETGAAQPRRFEYPISWNIAGVGAPETPWEVLRMVAAIPIVRRCLTVRIEQMCSLDWDIVPRNDAVDQMARTQGQGKHVVKRQIMTDLSTDIDRVRKAFQRPDKINGYSWDVWLSTVLDDHFTLDAIALKPWPQLNGDMNLVKVDATTIKPLLDPNGNRPLGGQPAYQQNVYGYPRGEFTASEDADAEFAANELIYAVRHPRPKSPYGYSMVENCIPFVALWIKRMKWMMDEFDEGVQPAGWFKSSIDVGMTPEQIRAYEYVFNQTYGGSSAERHRYRLLPKGIEPTEATEIAEKWKQDMDRWFLDNICAMLGVNPGELGFEPSHGGLGGKGLAEGQENVTYRRDFRPTIVFLRGVLDEVGVNYYGMDPLLTFSFIGAEVEDDAQDAKTWQILVMSGQKTLNDARAENGDPLYDMAEADEPFFLTADGPVFLSGTLAAQQSKSSSPEPPAGPVPPPQDGSGQPAGQGGQQPPPAKAPVGPTPPPPSPGRSGAGATPEAAEAQKFATFVERRRGRAWRDFEFTTKLAGHGTVLNAAAANGEPVKVLLADAVKAAMPDPKALVAKHREVHDKIVADQLPAIARAMSGLIDRTKLLSDLTAIAATPRPKGEAA